MKFRKLSGIHYRKEAGKNVCYRAGSIISATEEELKRHDENLATWEKVADNAVPTGSKDGRKTKEEFLFIMRQNSNILHPERLGLGQMYTPLVELGMRENQLPLAKLALKEKKQYHEHIQNCNPVDKREGKVQHEDINRAEAEVELILEEIVALRQMTQAERTARATHNEAVAAREKRQAETLAFHPHFKDDPAAQAVRERTIKTTPAKTMKLKRRAASA